jgi:hypothetical protein
VRPGIAIDQHQDGLLTRREIRLFASHARDRYITPQIKRLTAAKFNAH